MSQNPWNGDDYGQDNSSAYGHPHHSGPFPQRTADHPNFPPLPTSTMLAPSTIPPSAAQYYWAGGYRAMEEFFRANGMLQPHQTIPDPLTILPTLTIPTASTILPPSTMPPSSRPSNHPSRQGPPPTRAPNPLHPRQNAGFRQNRRSGPSTISRPTIDGGVRRTFQGQVRQRMEDVQCYNCKELGHPLKYCTVVGDHGFIYGCPRCNAGHFYDSCSNGKRKVNDNRHYLVQLRDGLCPIASNIDYRQEDGFVEREHRPLTPAYALQNATFFRHYDYTPKQPRARDPLMDHPMTIPSNLLTYDGVIAAAARAPATSSTINSSAPPFSSASDHQIGDLDEGILADVDYELPLKARTLEKSDAKVVAGGEDDDGIDEIMDMTLPWEKSGKEKGMGERRGHGV